MLVLSSVWENKNKCICWKSTEWPSSSSNPSEVESSVRVSVTYKVYKSGCLAHRSTWRARVFSLGVLSLDTGSRYQEATETRLSPLPFFFRKQNNKQHRNAFIRFQRISLIDHTLVPEVLSSCFFFKSKKATAVGQSEQEFYYWLKERNFVINKNLLPRRSSIGYGPV